MSMKILRDYIRTIIREEVESESPTDQVSKLKKDIESMSFQKFDQPPNSPWREVAMNGRFDLAIELIEHYLENAKIKIAHEEKKILVWHLGQMYAYFGDEKKAKEIFSSEDVRSKLDPEWNYYVDGTVAFLNKDKPTLKSAVAKLNKWYIDNDQDPEGPGNLKILKNFLENMGKPYSVVYEMD